jgi:hypothetical protein
MSVECPIFGDKSYLTLANEAVFGVQDGSPAYRYLPVLTYGLELLSDQRQPMPYTGMAEEFDNIIGQQHVAGAISTALYGWRNGADSTSLAEYIMAWAFTDLETLCNLPSKTAQWAEGPDVANKTHLGVTINGATLAGSDDNGSAITLNLDTLGSDEDPLTTAQTIPSDLERLNEFLFRDSTFSIGADSGSLTAIELKGFTWQQQRNLTPVYNGSLTPRRFRPGKPNATFEFNIEKADGTWDAIRRSAVSNNYYGRLILKGLHNGTGATGDYAKVQIDFPKLSFNVAKDTWARSGPALQGITFRIQKPTTTAASFGLTWSEV